MPCISRSEVVGSGTSTVTRTRTWPTCTCLPVQVCKPVTNTIRNRLSSQSTRALMCVGNWSRLGLVKVKDILPVLGDELNEDEDELPAGWDQICL